MTAVPFLYLPDAVSLLLLWTALSLLRELAVEHLRIDLVNLRNEAIEFGSAAGIPFEEPAYAGLQQLIDSTARLGSKISPARLFFVHRLWRRVLRSGPKDLVSDPIGDFERQAAGVPGKQVRDRLLRLRLEMVLKLGLFLLAGSVSGWILLLWLLVRIVWRLRSRPARERVDRFVDVWERLVSQLGRHTLTLAIQTEAGTSG